MPKRILIDGVEGNLLYFEAHVYRTFAEFRQALAKLLEDETMPASCRLIVDVSRTTYSPTSQELRDIAATIASARCNKGNSHIGVVVSNKLQYGLARMLGSYLEQLGVGMVIFEDKEQALASVARRAS